MLPPNKALQPRSRSSGKIFLAYGVEVCLNPFPGAIGMHISPETSTVSSIVACNGGANRALTGPLAPVMGRLKIHRPGGPLRGFVQQALKLPRWPDV